MNLQQFQEESRRTMPFKGVSGNPIEFENMLGNYTMGLAGETAEAYEIFNKEPFTADELQALKNELGDISHYAVGLAALANIELPEHIELELDPEDIAPCEVFKQLITETGLILDYAKKVIYHRHAFDATKLNVVEVLTLVKSIAKAYGLKYSEVLDANIDKLKTRYPEKFTPAASQARVDV